jgi:hypothetical protein
MWARASFVILQGGGGEVVVGIRRVVVVSAAMTLLVKGTLSRHWAELLSGPRKAGAGVA